MTSALSEVGEGWNGRTLITWVDSLNHLTTDSHDNFNTEPQKKLLEQIGFSKIEAIYKFTKTN